MRTSAGSRVLPLSDELGEHASSVTTNGSAYANAYEAYDQVDAEFDTNGLFLSWRAYVQR